ncbi:transaldolase [Candidatus Bathyarchaeota archaeon]|nr:transaldolase [Candidatus Bathyarchaeota archaeon]
MKFFLDSAKLDEIKFAMDAIGIEGVTTNPKHVKVTGKTFHEIIREFVDEFDGMPFPISVEINPHLSSSEEMEDAASKIAALSDNFCIKIPCTEQGLLAAKNLVESGIKVNLTLVFSASQALQGGRIGCTYVSPFIGWQESSGVRISRFINDIIMIYDNYMFNTEIIVAAVRDGRQIVEAATMGADIVTAGLPVYMKSFFHPFTNEGLKIFQDAWDETEIGKWE